MAKYSFEFKKKVVMSYLSGSGGYEIIAKQYGVASHNQVKKWVLSYQNYGDDGLLRSRQQKKYTFEYKLHVVELYLSSEVSYQELALQERINNPSILVKWVNNYRIAGPDALRPKKKGRKTTVSSAEHIKNTTSNETVPVDTNIEHIKQLEDELLKLRIENAFLKELRRLRLEDEAKMKDLRESSTASEDNSN